MILDSPCAKTIVTALLSCQHVCDAEIQAALRNVKRPGDFPNFDEFNEGKVNSMEDCFNNIQEPLYGFRTKVTLVDNEPCELGVTCDEDGNKIQRRLGFWKRSWQYDHQRKEWQSYRRKRHWRPYTLKKYYEPYRKAWAYDRQTGEEFVTGAPPDCRINNICRA